MSNKLNRVAAGEPWVWFTRELLNSDAWRTAGINVRRLIDFLCLEHLSHGGKKNGQLKAPHRQLKAFGIGDHFIADAITEAEKRGLIDCCYNGQRVATTYAIGWLPLYDGTRPADRWKAYRNEKRPRPKFKNLPAKQQADGSKRLPAKQQALYRNSYQGGAVNSELSGEQGPGTPAAEAAVPRSDARSVGGAAR